MVKRLVTFSLVVPLLVLFVLWSHRNAERQNPRIDHNVCKIREGC